MSALCCRITSKYGGEFYCLNCLHPFRTKNKLKSHENVWKSHDHCYIEVVKEESMLKYNHEEKSMKVPLIIYADMESLLEKIGTCYNNPEKSSTIKINKHTASDYSLFTYCSFDVSKNKHNYYRGKDCMKIFSKDLGKHVTKIYYEKKKK